MLKDIIQEVDGKRHLLLNEKQQQFIKAGLDPNGPRVIVNVKARRFGKTTESLVLNTMLMMRKPHAVTFFMAPTTKHAKRLLWKPQKQFLDMLGIPYKANKTDGEIELKNGSTLYFGGFGSEDEYEKVRGLGPDAIICDESKDMPPEAYFDTFNPALADNEGLFVIQGTPSFTDDTLWQFKEKAKQHSEWVYYHATTADGGNVSDKEIEYTKRSIPSASFKREYLAQWVDFVGGIYPYFKEHHVEKFEWSKDDKRVIFIGMDFNFEQISAACAWSDGRNIHVFDEILIDCREGLRTWDMCDEIKKRFPGSHIVIYPDASSSQQSPNSRNSNRKILDQAGFEVRSHKRNPFVDDRINSVNGAFRNGYIKIDPKCNELIKCLHMIKYKNKTGEVDKTKGYDHMVDAFGYMVEHINPMRYKEPTSESKITGPYEAMV